MKAKFEGVNFIKFFSFFTIFALHIEKISCINTNNIARFGVYLFIILSGFLMMYNYEDKFEDISFKKVFVFVKNKIIKFYPLFIIALLIKTPATLLKYYYEFNGINFSFFYNTIVRLLSSVFLIQAYIPDPNFHFAFNGVSWFLDILILCYCFTPFFVKAINKNSQKKNLIIMCIIIALQIVYQLIINKVVGDDYWYYIFPPYRLFDYLVGMILYKLIKDKMNNECKHNIYSILEILLILSTVGFFYYDLFLKSIGVYLLAIFTIIIFIQNKGFISKKCNSVKFINNVCAINLELFLLHQPIIRYIEFIYEKCPVHNMILNIFVSIVTFVLIYFTCMIYKNKISKLFKRGKENG